jgi:D-xylose transport system permease protein
VVGLIIIAIVFQTQNSNFLTAGNFVNLIVQAAAFATIGMGIVFVLLLGEIDLSVGFVSGVAGVLVALLTFPDNHNVFAAGPALVLALAAGVGIGLLHGVIITKLGVPSFVVTLAGLLAWNGAVLLLIGDRGTVIIQNTFFIGFANDFLPSATAWILAVAGIVLYAAMLFWQRAQRTRAGLVSAPDSVLLLRIAGFAIGVLAVAYVCDQDRGIPYVMLVMPPVHLLDLCAQPPKPGRHIYAVGGSAGPRGALASTSTTSRWRASPSAR